MSICRSKLALIVISYDLNLVNRTAKVPYRFSRFRTQIVSISIFLESASAETTCCARKTRFFNQAEKCPLL